MATVPAYREWLKQDLGTVIDALELRELQKHFLRSRWLDQVVWMEGRANAARDRYYALRLTAIIGGVIVPALVSLNVDGQGARAIGWLTFALSLLVAISVAVEEFFHYGERWRHYRRTVEELKIIGWQFFQLSGSYDRHQSHTEAYREFATRVEAIIQRDVEVYITEVVREETKEPENRNPVAPGRGGRDPVRPREEAKEPENRNPVARADQR
jgi:hypothetical protein